MIKTVYNIYRSNNMSVTAGTIFMDFSFIKIYYKLKKIGENPLKKKKK